MPQDHGAGILAGALGDLLGHVFGHAAQNHVLATDFRRTLGDHLSPSGDGAFGHDHDAILAAVQFIVHQLVADLFDIERYLRNQDHVRVPRDAAVQGDKAGIAPHHLYHHDPVMGLGRRVQTVDRLGGDADRRIETEGDDGAPHVVVDGLGHADHRHAFFGEAVGDLQATVAADGHQRIEAQPAEVVHHLVRQIALFPFAGRVADRHHEGVSLIGGPQDGATDAGDAVHLLRCQVDDLIGVQQAGIATFDAVNFPLPIVGGHGDRLDDGVQARRVATAGIDADLHSLLHAAPLWDWRKWIIAVLIQKTCG